MGLKGLLVELFFCRRCRLSGTSHNHWPGPGHSQDVTKEAGQASCLVVVMFLEPSSDGVFLVPNPRSVGWSHVFGNSGQQGLRGETSESLHVPLAGGLRLFFFKAASEVLAIQETTGPATLPSAIIQTHVSRERITSVAREQPPLDMLWAQARRSCC